MEPVAQTARGIPESSADCPLSDVAAPWSAAESARELMYTVSLVAIGFLSARQLLRLGRGGRTGRAPPHGFVEAQAGDTCCRGSAWDWKPSGVPPAVPCDNPNPHLDLFSPEARGVAWAWKDSAPDDETLSPSGCSEDMVDDAVFAQDDCEVAERCDRWLEGALSLEHSPPLQDQTHDLGEPASHVLTRAALQQLESLNSAASDGETGMAQNVDTQLGVLWQVSLL